MIFVKIFLLIVNDMERVFVLIMFFGFMIIVKDIVDFVIVRC